MEQLLKELENQEKELQFEHFSNTDAINLGMIVYEIAKRESLPITVDITRGGQQLFHLSMPGTAPDNDFWIQRKIKLVNRIQHSSFYIGRRLLSQGQTLEEGYELNHFEYAAHGGCFPIVINGSGMIGTLTVSGLEQSLDHSLAVRAIRQFLNR